MEHPLLIAQNSSTTGTLPSSGTRRMQRQTKRMPLTKMEVIEYLGSTIEETKDDLLLFPEDDVEIGFNEDVRTFRQSLY